MSKPRVTTNLTVNSVQKLPTAAKPYEVRDGKLKGLIVRVQPSGSKTYYFEYLSDRRSDKNRRLANRIRIGSADSLEPEQARAAAKNIEAEHRISGIDPVEKGKKVQAGTYLQFIETDYTPYLSAHLRNGVDNKENVAETVACLKGRFPDFHGLPLNAITSQLIDKWKQHRTQDGVKPSTINRQMNDLRACLNKAVEWGALEKNPFDKVKACKTDSNAKVRYLSQKEEVALRQALADREAYMRKRRESFNAWKEEREHTLISDLADQAYVDHLMPAVLISLNTGLRRGELLSLTWKNVDLENRTLTVVADTAKSARTRHVRLNDEAMIVFKSWKNQPGVKSALVFCDNDGQPFNDMRTSWVKLLDRAKITDFRWHDLRHTFASNLVMAGIDLNTVRELLGHSDYKMTLRYAHLAPGHMQEAVNRLVAKAATS